MNRVDAPVQSEVCQSFVNRIAGSFLHLFLLAALCGALYFPYLGSTPFFDKGEPREALAVQDIVQRGEWLVPLKRATDIPSKPPLFHWSAAAVSLLKEELSEPTIRFPSAVYATLGVLFLYVFGRKLFGPEVALLGGAILATTTVYQNQALSARVDMTLCFFVMISLGLFYFLYRGFLRNEIWYYVFFSLVGISVLAKGPLGIVLPALVAGVFVILKKRWDLIAKFGLHPGVLLMLILGAGWYVIAVTRGGEGFFDRQIIEENLSRFAGGSGHSHPPHYYIPYLFALGLPWSLFLPFLAWDFFQRRFSSDDDNLFLALWFLVMFVFFSISMGKRPVYILPIYPALSLLMAVWFYRHGAATGVRRVLYRFIAALAGAVGLTLIIITVGALWSHDPGWFFSPVERLLKAKDRANLLVVKTELATFGWSFTVVSLLSGVLWLSLGRSLWLGRLRSAAWQLVLIAVPVAFITRAVVMPVIAEAKSYRAFMAEVNQLVKPHDHLYLYGDSFNSDPLVFYRGEPIDTLKHPEEVISNRIGGGDQYVIMSQKEWRRISDINRNLPPPLLKSEGKGPEGDAPLVLFKGKINFFPGNESSQSTAP
ncbi:MAG TPA: glycosyltransferase family 39 protein [Candidatus Binatia bacterium]|jgi:4-amino-4-deoxy-L-arabinose transferase-like glycosyltransferase